jgi:hypothetical protein
MRHLGKVEIAGPNPAQGYVYTICLYPITILVFFMGAIVDCAVKSPKFVETFRKTLEKVEGRG